MLYEVLIPAADPNGYDEAITVDAGNWMAALKSGLERTGEPAADIRNVMCDIKDDNTIHVTDAVTRRVFILTEVDPEVDEEAERLRREAKKAAAQAIGKPNAKPGVTAQARVENANALTEPLDSVVAGENLLDPDLPSKPVHEDAPVIDHLPPVAVSIDMHENPPAAVDVKAPEADMVQTNTGSWTSADGRMRVGSATYDSIEDDLGTPVVLRETRSKSTERPIVQQREENNVGQNILEDIFLEIQAIHENNMTMEDTVNFVMDMAMEKVPADSGAVLFADVNGKELYFATARGPKSHEIMSFRVPMGTGISGFCAKQGVSLAISDAQRDPRFYRRINEATGYNVNSVVCAPIQHEGRVYGCIELMNRSGGSLFSSHEVNALTYIGKQFAEYINRLIMANEKL